MQDTYLEWTGKRGGTLTAALDDAWHLYQRRYGQAPPELCIAADGDAPATAMEYRGVPIRRVGRLSSKCGYWKVAAGPVPGTEVLI